MKRFAVTLATVLLIAGPAFASPTYDGFYTSPNVKFYAAASGTNDAGNTCTSATYPCTLAGAVNAAALQNLANGGFYTVELAAGTYTAGFFASGRSGGGTAAATQSTTKLWNFVGLIGQGSGTTTLADASGSAAAIIAVRGAKIAVRGLTITSTGGSLLFPSGGGSEIYIDKDVIFGQSKYGQLHAEMGGIISSGAGYTIAGAGWSAAVPAHYQAVLGGHIIMDEVNNTITLTGTPNFTDFADIESASTLYVPHGNITFSGAVNAATVKYSASVNGVIETNSAAVSYFPGAAASGVTPTGGQYH